jgi:hypothetical protein
MHPMMILGFVLLAAVALLPISYLALAPDIDPVQVYMGPSHGGPADGAAPNRDPQHAGLMPTATAEPVVTPATPNHDARHLQPIPFLALDQAALRAEPEPAQGLIVQPDLIAQQIVAMGAAAPSAPAPAFAATDTVLYARDSARLRAAPSTTADVMAKLAADAPLHAVARSTDGTWWQVSLAGGRFGYVHQTAVTQDRAAKAKPSAAPAPVVASARSSPQPEWQRRSQDLFRYVDKTMTWLADQAGGGTAPKVVRSER